MPVNGNWNEKCSLLLFVARFRFWCFQLGYSRKYPPPLWTTLNWVLKNFRISKNNSSRFFRIPNLADSKDWGIPEFCKTFNDFGGIPVKIHNILGKFMDFQSSLLSIFYRISNVVRGVCVWIFSGIAQCCPLPLPAIRCSPTGFFMKF